MNIPVISGIVDFLKGGTEVIKEMVVDKDKQAELVDKQLERAARLQEKLITTTTTPKVDAFVKILYALKDTVLPLMRPVGSAIMTAFGMYCHYKQIPIDPVLHGILDGAFPGWGVSRHVEKNKQK